MLAVALPLAFALFVPVSSGPPADPEAAFETLTGAELVWSRDEMPPDVLFDRTPALPSERRAAAATILLAEAQKYPPGFFRQIGLTKIGVFEACVADKGDGFRAYEEALAGYRYYGQWAAEDGHGALIAAFYSEWQLPQTFHHEVFHHVDATVKGVVDYAHFKADDARFAAALDGSRLYRAPKLAPEVVKKLSEAGDGERLDGANGSYSEKSANEDQAEAARWLMTHLADGLAQAAEDPGSPGSQRILHLLTQYAGAAKANRADLDWFVGRALGREVTPATADVDTTRTWLDAQAKLAKAGRPSAAPAAIARATIDLVRDRILPKDGDSRFTVWTPPRFQGGSNPVLQADVRQIAIDAARLHAWRTAPTETTAVLRAAQDELLTLLLRYRAFIDDTWGLSEPSAETFAVAERTIKKALLGATAAVPARDNPHLGKVDEAIADPAWRAAIRGVQPAAVKIGQGSGVNLGASGLILTNAHVAEKKGDVYFATFPDGSRYRGVTIASDHHADLALVRLEKTPGDLPVAPIAKRAPEVGSDVAIVGQPGKTTPNGEPTGYDGWHVSVGKIRGFLDDIYGDQSLGRTKHSAWTYWGHSGSPLFNRAGAIVALHNSWDSTTAMRHAVPHEVIVKFLDESGARYKTR